MRIRVITLGLGSLLAERAAKHGYRMTHRTYIALLRGINVGGKVLKMADLKEAVAKLGFEGVETYLQSGNMVFKATADGNDAIAQRISKAIREHRSMDVAVMVRDAGQWDALVSANPYPQAHEFPKTVHTFIFDETPDADRIETLEAKDAGREEWQIVDGTLYLHTPDGFGKSVLGNVMERILKVPMTARNWNTVLALRDIAGKS